MSDSRGGERSDVGGHERLAIDRTVRQMLDLEPPPDFRARVIDAIDRPVAPAVGRTAWFVAPLAAAAIVILAVMLGRHSEPPAQAPVVASAVDQQVPSPTGSVPPKRTQRATAIDAPTPPAETQVARAPRTAVIAAASTPASAQTDTLEPLRAITPIEVAPIVPSSIAPESIAVRPLTAITEMQISPLNPPDRRN
jgi:hypothetical protein